MNDWNRFVNNDTIVNNNVFSYCANNPIIRIDPTGKAFEDLEVFLYKKYITHHRYTDVDHFTYGVFADGVKSIRLRETPFCSSLAGYEVVSEDEIENLYVFDQTHTEGDDLPDGAIDNDPNRVWFNVVVFFKDYRREPFFGYVWSNNLYVPHPLKPYYLGSRENDGYVNVREEPGEKSNRLYEVQSDTPVTLLKIDPEKNWHYVNTPYGNGWVHPDYIHVPFG